MFHLRVLSSDASMLG